MSTTPNMTLTLPIDHASTDIWGAALNAAMLLVDAHDHSTGKGVKVSQTGIGITGDLTFASHAATNMSVLDLIPVTATSAAPYSSALFANSSDSNNLYWRNSSGANVQITNGGTLNFSVTGGFGGDYASAGALADFIDANDTFHFYQQLGGGVRQYARMAFSDIDLFEYKANPATGVPTNRVRQKSPAALAASYDLTWFAALPAGAQLLSVDNVGALTAGTVNTALAANVNLTLSGTGSITLASGNVTAADLFHTTAHQTSVPFAGGNVSGAGSLTLAGWASSSNGYSLQSGLFPVRQGDIITSVVTEFVPKAAGTYTFNLLRYNPGGFNSTTVVETWSNAASGATVVDSHTMVTPYNTVAGTRVHLQIVAPAGAGSTDQISDIHFAWTHPS